MDMKEVTSSTIHSVGHDPERNVLRVRFHNGGTYEYENVDAKLHESFVGAKSVGAFHGAHLKDAKKYPFKRLDKKDDKK